MHLAGCWTLRLLLLLLLAKPSSYCLSWFSFVHPLADVCIWSCQHSSEFCGLLFSRVQWSNQVYLNMQLTTPLQSWHQSSLLILFLRCGSLQGTFTHLLCRCWKSAKNEREHTCKSAQTGPPSNVMKWSQQKRSNRTSFWNEKKKAHFPCSLISQRQQSSSFLNPCFQEEVRSFLLPFFTSPYRVAICSSALLPWSTLSQCWLGMKLYYISSFLHCLFFLEQVHLCLVSGPAAVFLTSMISYLLFPNPPIKLKLGLWNAGDYY